MEPQCTLQTTSHVVHPRINPRLKAYPDEVIAMLLPVHESLTRIWTRLDALGSGFLSLDLVKDGLKETGVFLTKVEACPQQG